MPNVGLKLTTPRSRVAHSTDRTSQAPLELLYFKLCAKRRRLKRSDNTWLCLQLALGKRSPTWVISVSLGAWSFQILKLFKRWRYKFLSILWVQVKSQRLADIAALSFLSQETLGKSLHSPCCRCFILIWGTGTTASLSPGCNLSLSKRFCVLTIMMEGGTLFWLLWRPTKQKYIPVRLQRPFYWPCLLLGSFNANHHNDNENHHENHRPYTKNDTSPRRHTTCVRDPHLHGHYR